MPGDVITITPVLRRPRPHQHNPGRIFDCLSVFREFAMNRFTIDALEPAPNDHILEIGSGNGFMIEMLTLRHPSCSIAGIDQSHEMVVKAARRNSRAIAKGKVALEVATVESLPFESRCFDRVCAVDSFHRWPSQEPNLEEVRRVMKDGARLVLAEKASSLSKADRSLGEGLLRWVGFHNVRTIGPRFGHGFVCLTAEK